MLYAYKTHFRVNSAETSRNFTVVLVTGLCQVGKTIILKKLRSLKENVLHYATMQSFRRKHIINQSYIETYLQHDIRDLTQVANEMQFYNFIIVVAAHTSKPVIYEELAAAAWISAPTEKNGFLT